MKKTFFAIFFFASLLLSSTLYAATVAVTCSTQATKAVINEVNTNSDFIEIYLNQSADILNWELFVDASSKATLGHGNCFINGTSTKDDEGSGVTSTTFPAGTFITCDTNMNPSNNEILLTDRDISHSGSPGAVTIDYLSYGTPTPSAQWSVPPGCSTLYSGHAPSNRDIARIPDGTGVLSDNGDNVTKGTSNGGSLPAVIAEYRMDECLWNGTTSEVTDNSGNGYHATLKKTTMTLENAKVCGGPTAFNDNSYVELPTAFPNLTTNFTITGWFNSSDITQTGQRIFIDDRYNTNGYGLSVNDAGGRYLRFYHRGQPNSGIIDATGATLSSNTWYFAAAVADTTHAVRHLYIFNSAGTLLNHKTMAILGSLGVDTGTATIGGEPDGGETSNRFKGSLDEIKVFASALSQAQLQSIVNNEKSGLNYDGTNRTCPTCTLTPLPTYTFDAWDTFRSISDRNISTKIVNKPFDLNISSLNETQTALQDFNGTVCARIVNQSGTPLTGWNKLVFNSVKSMPATFLLNRAVGGSDSAGIQIMWKKDAPAATACDALTDTNTTIASDRFAIRPASFSVAAPNAVAGVDFNITFTAPIYGAAAGSTDYNESAGSSFDLSIAEHNASCPMGVFTPVPGSFSFINGSKIFTTRYSEVGLLDVNLSDTAKECALRYTRVDCDDTNVSDGSTFTANLLPIGMTQVQIPVKPDHFDVNATLVNSGGSFFTYLSADLNMSATLNLLLSAKNGEGNTTKNYDKGCYAKSTTLTIPHTLAPDPLTKIFYHETLSATDGNVTKSSDITLSLTHTVFTQGTAPLLLGFNFDRDRSKPLNPFDFGFTSASIIDTDGVMGSGTPLGTATFVYGRARAYDITTNETSAPNPVEFEVYSTVPTGYVSGMPQNVLKWYRNLKHTTAAQGSVLRGGFSAGTTNSAINVSAPPQNGIQIVTVTSAADQTVHLDITPWLWYSPGYNYDYTAGCTQHPCFRYDYTNTAAGVSGVSSGTFQGSDFQMAPAKNITNKGVKLFR